MKDTLPVLGFAAFSGTGKTTLLKQLIPLLAARGVRVGVIKHAHHNFDIDKPGKDSFELRKAGAHQMLIASSQRQALMTENSTPQEPRLDDLITRLDRGKLDLVLVEGFRQAPFPKIELHRQALGKTLLYPQDTDIIAVASDHPADCRELPSLDINDSAAIAAFIVAWLDGSTARTG
jgi:molybdopterin-guanine dinucleotide biosynthesis protein MobB